MTSANSKVSVKCDRTQQMYEISGKLVLVASGPCGTLQIARWVCPGCQCKSSTSDVATVTVFLISGARQAASIVAVPMYCEPCDHFVLQPPREVLVHVPGDFSTRHLQLMTRHTCPVCSNINLSPEFTATARGMVQLGATVVTDVLDLVPDEVELLNEAGIDLMALLEATPDGEGCVPLDVVDRHVS